MIVVNKWFHKVTNYQVLSRPNICGLQLMIDKKKLRWTGRVILWRAIVFLEHCFLKYCLSTGIPKCGNHHNNAKSTLREFGISCTVHIFKNTNRVSSQKKRQEISNRVNCHNTVTTCRAGAEVNCTVLGLILHVCRHYVQHKKHSIPYCSSTCRDGTFGSQSDRMIIWIFTIQPISKMRGLGPLSLMQTLCLLTSKIWLFDGSFHSIKRLQTSIPELVRLHSQIM